jgi:hypothetical protein
MYLDLPGPPVCVPCMCLMRRITSTTQRARWRCSWCGATPIGDPRNVSSTSCFPEGTLYNPPWHPGHKDKVVLAKGAEISRYSATMMGTPTWRTKRARILTVHWSTRRRVAWIGRNGIYLIGWVWDVLPAPSLMEQLARSQDE